MADASEVRLKAMDYLARREHSAFELRCKLQAKGYVGEVVDEVLDRLAQEGLQSDQRLASAYVMYRGYRGYGPDRVRLELRQKGVDDEIIDLVFHEADMPWASILQDTLHKKRRRRRLDLTEQASIIRFLRHRGFQMPMIQTAMQTLSPEDE